MTNDNFRPCSLLKEAELLSKGQVPPFVAQTIKLGRMTALRKDTRHCLWISYQQVDCPTDWPSSEGIHALSTRAGLEYIAHALLTSIDGIGAYDSISRRAMLLGLERVEGGQRSSLISALVLSHTASAFVGRR